MVSTGLYCSLTLVLNASDIELVADAFLRDSGGLYACLNRAKRRRSRSESP